MPALIVIAIALVLGFLAVYAAGRRVPDCNHAAPDYPVTVGEAHALMQLYRDCDHELCPAKARAYVVLVDAGKLVPEARSSR